MIRLLEVVYLVGVPLGVVLLIAALFFKRQLRYGLLTASVIVVATWTWDLRALSARSEHILNHYNDYVVDAGNFVSASWISTNFGSPDSIIVLDHGFSAIFYSVRVWPWNAMAVFYVGDGHILDAQASDKIDLFFVPAAFLRNTDFPAGVPLFVAMRDKTTWVDLSNLRTNIPEEYSWDKTGRWVPNTNDIPPIIDAACSYAIKTEMSVTGDESGSFAKSYYLSAAHYLQGFRSVVVCQLICYSTGGKRMIHLNFFSKLHVPHFAQETVEPAWHTQYVEVLGGGSSFWHVDYDPAWKTFSHFEVNGPM